MTGGDDSSTPETGLPDALRTAVERTLTLAGKSAKASSAALSADRRSELLDELARRGRGARDELARRGQEAGVGLSRRGQDARDELARRGQDARDELARRLETVEKRLVSIEELLRNQSKGNPEG